MSKRVNHNKCPLCRKKFTAKRHSILNGMPYYDESLRGYRWGNSGMRLKPLKPVLRRILDICGHCKAKLKNGRLDRWHKWCDSHSISYREESVPLFDTDKVVLNRLDPKKHPIHQAGHGSYWYKGRGSKKLSWVKEHNDTVKNLKNPKFVEKLQKEWQPKELKEFNRMVQEERMIKKSEEAAIMTQLENEYSEPFRKWLEK